jgi:hypothetical protein
LKKKNGYWGWLLDCIATQCPPQLGKTAVTCDGS